MNKAANVFNRTSVGFELWVATSAFWVAAGWLLSLCGALNRSGYFIAGVIFAGLFFYQKRKGSLCFNGRRVFRLRRHFPFRLRCLPLIYFIIAACALLGGIFHPPNNYDALTYRFPRLLHWMSEGHWHWITTNNDRMNYSGAASEWLLAPLFAWSQSDRLFFLTNFIPYLLLPGLVFSVFRHLGVSRRLSWFWMWLMPCAYCFAMQAGGIGNDALVGSYLLCSLYFGLRGLETNRMKDFSLSLLSVALVTAVKGSNLPLLLPCAIVLWHARHVFLKNYLATTVVLVIVVLISFLPTAFLNQRYTGHWTGDPKNKDKMQLHNPVAAFLGNAIQLSIPNLAPPILPQARSLQSVLARLLPDKTESWLQDEFPRFQIRVGELPQEEESGCGVGLSLILMVTFGAQWSLRRVSEKNASRRLVSMGWWMGLSAWAALLVYMGKMGSEATARLLTPYYLLLCLPVLLLSGSKWLPYRKWWQILAILVAASALPGLILTPSRPLFPAEKIFSMLQSKWPQNAQVMRAANVYRVYGHRSDALAPLRQSLPSDARVVGFIGGNDDSEIALWRPFGERKVKSLVGLRSWDEETEDIRWLVGKTSVVVERYKEQLPVLLERRKANLVTTTNITSKLSTGPEEWFVAELPVTK